MLAIRSRRGIARLLTAIACRGLRTVLALHRTLERQSAPVGVNIDFEVLLLDTGEFGSQYKPGILFVKIHLGARPDTVVAHVDVGSTSSGHGKRVHRHQVAQRRRWEQVKVVQGRSEKARRSEERHVAA